MTYRSGDKYEGHWHLDMRHGQAQYVSQAGDVFDGTYRDDLRDGPGTVAKVTEAISNYLGADVGSSDISNSFSC